MINLGHHLYKDPQKIYEKSEDMEVIERLKSYYKENPPRLSYGGSEGEAVRGKVYHEWPKEEELKALGSVVWRAQFPASPDASQPPDGYCAVDAYLDPSGHTNPDALLFTWK